jgi:hypothetical protein
VVSFLAHHANCLGLPKLSRGDDEPGVLSPEQITCEPEAGAIGMP